MSDGYRPNTILAQRTLEVGHIDLWTEAGEAREMAAMLRFVDMWDHLEPNSCTLLQHIRWFSSGNYLRIRVWNTSDNGLPLTEAEAERLGERMAKILWNLGAPTWVVLTSEEADYELYFEDPKNPEDKGNAA